MQLKRLFAPVAALIAATGCFASKGDIALLQDEIRTMRAMEARADSAQLARVDQALLMMRRTSDSLRALSLRFGAFQATMSGELFELGKQLITIQELTGMSSRRIMDLRAAMEERSQNMQVPDTTASAGANAPGPAQLFTAASDLMRRGSHGTARQGFEELLRLYPSFEQASLALLYIGQTYTEERRTAEADSVYSLVVSRYPRSADAATALYKYGLSQLSQGRTAAGRAALNRILREFPSSTEAELARERLRSPR
jgi:tol-pal system protein YbgF